MQCDQFEELLSEYMDGSLAQALKSNMDAHRSGCSACSQLVSEMQLIYTAIDTMPALDTPPWMHERIMARVESEGIGHKKRSVWHNPWTWLGSTAAAAAIVMVALILPSAQQPQVQMSLLSRQADTVTNQQAQLSLSTELVMANGEAQGWVLRLTPQKPQQAEVFIVSSDGQTVSENSYWKGQANGQPISLPTQSLKNGKQAMYAQVNWSDNSTTSLWLPQQLLPDGHLARVSQTNVSMEQAFGTISGTWGVQIILKGHVQPNVRLTLNTRAASVDDVMASMANMLDLQLNRPNTDTFILSQK